MLQEELHPLILPDLGLADILLRTSLWLVPRGSFVREGDRVLEVLAGEVTFDIVSPATGVLCQQSTEEDEIVLAGQILGHIRATDNA
ncbi:biotin attachment protein [bacterium]|nr:biotin attachment protein [bacterium]